MKGYMEILIPIKDWNEIQRGAIITTHSLINHFLSSMGMDPFMWKWTSWATYPKHVQVALKYDPDRGFL